jgi:hypothetical protein
MEIVVTGRRGFIGSRHGEKTYHEPKKLAATTYLEYLFLGTQGYPRLLSRNGQPNAEEKGASRGDKKHFT